MNESYFQDHFKDLLNQSYKASSPNIWGERALNNKHAKPPSWISEQAFNLVPYSQCLFRAKATETGRVKSTTMNCEFCEKQRKDLPSCRDANLWTSEIWRFFLLCQPPHPPKIYPRLQRPPPPHLASRKIDAGPLSFWERPWQAGWSMDENSGGNHNMHLKTRDFLDLEQICS